ncbi:MAG: hypothetical protein Q8K85_13790, partial [Hyphomicrobium sp.]|nr:hypothetical protein [Hyphomicrobium sp.]
MDAVISAPVATNGDFAADVAAFSAYWRTVREQLDKQPTETLKLAAREARFLFLRTHANTLYDRLTDGRRKFVRLERLVYDAADIVPGL